MKNRPPLPQHLSRHRYHMLLVRLQIELVKQQRSVIERGQRILVIVEGRDAAGKDGTIKSIVEHLSPRDTRVIARGPPSNREQRSWYFQRHVPHLPAAGEIVLLNRSWYNRAGVERVMGFCNKEETEEFLETVPAFEAMIERSGITLLKYYLDISKLEQKRRLTDRFGALVSLNNADSLRGRVGLSLNHQNVWNDGSGIVRSDVYAIGNLHYEFLNGTRIDVAGTGFANTNDRLWGSIGGGGTYSWANGRYAVFGEITYRASLEDPSENHSYRGTGGFRVTW